jgi:HEAT repeat protein
MQGGIALAGPGWVALLIVLLGPPVDDRGGAATRRSFASDQAQKRLLDRLSKPAAVAVESAPVQASDVPTRDLTDDELIAQLDEPMWVLRSPAPDPPLEYRSPWHHPAVTELAARLRSSPELQKKLSKTLHYRIHRGGPEGRFHAALVLAEIGDRAGMEELNRQLLDSDAPLPVRTSAACALARFGALLRPEELERLLLPWLADRTSSRRVVAEKDEPLVTAISHALFKARSADAKYDPSRDDLAEYLGRSPHRLLRRVTAMSYAGRAWETIPASLSRLLDDSDPMVRQSALAAVLAHPTAASKGAVLRMTQDTDLDVSVTAISGLTFFPDTQTLTRLEELAGSASPRIRQAVVESAGKLGQEAMVLRGAGDPQASVRVAAAYALASVGSKSALVALGQMLGDDRASVVQSAVLESLVGVPLADSGPLFLLAMNSSSARTRSLAVEALEAALTRPTARESYSAISIDRCRQALAAYQPVDSLEARGKQHAAVDQAFAAMSRSMRRSGEPASTVGGSKGVVPSEISPGLASLVQRYGTGPLPTKAMEELSRVPLAHIEQAVLAADLLPSEDFMLKILAPKDAAYGWIATLDAATPSTVTSLVAQFERRPMSPLQAVMVAMAVHPEEGRDVWVRLVPRAIESLSTWSGPISQVAMDRMVRLGLAHPDEMVREAICKELGDHPTAAPPEEIVRAMSDPSERVRRAAIRAAGATADKETRVSLVEAIRSPSVAIQLEAAAQLIAQGEKEGFETIRRLSSSPDDEVRRRVVEVLTKNPRVDREGTLQLLTQFLSDAKLEVRQRAVAGLEIVVGPLDGESEPAAGPKRAFTEEQVSRWKRTMASYFSPADSDDKLRRMELIRKTQESLKVLPVAN